MRIKMCYFDSLRGCLLASFIFLHRKGLEPKKCTSPVGWCSPGRAPAIHCNESFPVFPINPSKTLDAIVMQV